MKKIITIALLLLMILANSLIVQATEGEVAEVVQEATSETAEAELLEKTDIITDTVAKVIEAKEVKEVVTGTMKDKVQEVTIEITEGDYIGEEFTTDFVLSYDIEGKILAYELEKGDKVIVQLAEDAEGNVTATVQDVVRSNYIILMFVFFLASIVLIGGRKGVKAIIGLLLTIIFIYLILVRRIFAGGNAILTTILTSMLIIAATFVVIGGINKKIITAAIGTLGGVITAGLVALLFNHLAKMSGACEDAIQLSINMSTISFNFRDLLFVGIIISALGACMDVGMSIASSLDEIKMKNPDITWIELFKSGMNIGRDVIGTMTNTLILAYVGTSLTLILLFMACNMGFNEILNKETIAEQVIAAIAGSIGVVYTVPITAFVYSILNKDRIIYNKTAENKINGQRTLKI